MLNNYDIILNISLILISSIHHKQATSPLLFQTTMHNAEKEKQLNSNKQASKQAPLLFQISLPRAMHDIWF